MKPQSIPPELDREWLEKISQAIFQQAWAQILQLLGNMAIIASTIIVAAVIIAAKFISPTAGCITAIVIVIAIAIAAITASKKATPNRKALQALAEKELDALKPKKH
jgi:hypothetical protein